MSNPVNIYLDESSSLTSEDNFFCVGLLCDSFQQEKALANIIKNARNKILRKKLKSLNEIKFYHSDETTRQFILSSLPKIGVKAAIFSIDKKGRKVDDSPENYAIAIGAAIGEMMTKYHQVNLTIDKRYSNDNQQRIFLETCQKSISIFSPVGIRSSVFFNSPVDSRHNSAIQIADFIAGAANSKYNKEKDKYLKLLKEIIEMEKTVNWVDIKKRAVKP